MGLITGTKSFLKLEDSNLPYITIGKSTKNQKGSFVDLDHFKAAEIIVEHLVEQHKRKKIYLITGFSKFLCYENYINGYKSALMKYNLPFDNSQVKEGNTDEKMDTY